MAPSSSDSSIQVPTSKQVPSIHELYHLLFHKDEHIMKPFIHKLIPSSSTSSSSTNTDTKKVQQDVVRNIQIQPWLTKKSSSKTTTTTTIEEERRITFQLVNLPIPKLFSSLFSSSSSSSSNNNNNNNNTTTKSSHDKKEEVIIDVNMQFQTTTTTTTTIDATTIQIKCPITFSNSTASSHDDLSFVTFFDVQLEWTLTNNQNTMIVNMKSHGRLNHSTANWIPMFQSTIQQFIQKKQKTWIQLAQQQLSSSSSSSIPKSSASTTTTTTTNINDKKSTSTTTTTTTTTSTTTSNNHNDQSDKKKQKKSLVMKMMKPFLLSTNWTKKKQKDTDEKNNSATTNNNDLDDSLIVMMNAIQVFFSFLWFYLCVVYHFVIHLFHQVQSQFSDVSSSTTTTTASKDKKHNKQQQQLNTGAVVSNGVNKIRKRLFSSS